MASSSDPETIKRAIARIRHPNGNVVGAGFLISKSCLLTCAHVVTEALGLPQTQSEAPTGLVELDFPFDPTANLLKARVVFWSRVNPGKRGEDIAGLKLEGEIFEGLHHLCLIKRNDWWKHSFGTFGFPLGHDSGIWANGELREQRGDDGWVQMEAIKAQGYAIQQGFSGSPIWDEHLGAVVGMAVAVDRERETQAAFMIPTEILAVAIEALSLIEILFPVYGQNEHQVKTAFKACCPNGWSRPMPETLAAIIAELQDMPQGNAQYSRILQFVARLASVVPALEGWVVLRGYGWQALLETIPTAHSISQMSYLVIKVDDTKPKSGQYLVKAGFAPCAERWDANCRGITVPPTQAEREGFTPEEIPGLLDGFLDQVDEFRNLTIEFFLPLDLLNHAVDTWETQGFGISRVIGHEYRVIVRSVERIGSTYNRYRGTWRQKWQVLQTEKPQLRDALISADGHDPKSLLTQLESETAIGAKLTRIPESTALKGIFAALLQSGVPTGLWLRQCPPLCNSQEDFALTLNCCVMELPRQVKQARANACGCNPDSHIGHHLSLLWEDPDRLPEILQYKMP